MSGPTRGGAGHHGPTSLPERRSNEERCSGHTMAPFSTVPWSSGVPMCGHTLAAANVLPPLSVAIRMSWPAPKTAFSEEGLRSLVLQTVCRRTEKPRHACQPDTSLLGHSMVVVVVRTRHQHRMAPRLAGMMADRATARTVHTFLVGKSVGRTPPDIWTADERPWTGAGAWKPRRAPAR